MHTVILDGYNVIHAVPELARQLDRNLEAARSALVRVCREYLARRHDVQRLYVVFDGAGPEGLAGREVADRLTLIFTPGTEDADDRILSLAAARPRAGASYMIVSNDTYVFNNARAHGARAISVSEFMSQAVPALRQAPRRGAADEKAALPAHARQAITDEYRRHLETRRKAKR